MESTDPTGNRELLWRVSSSCQGGACIQVAQHGGMIAVGDSKHSDGPILTFDLAEFGAFIARIRRGDFDDL
jgi:hypothetical protein